MKMINYDPPLSIIFRLGIFVMGGFGIFVLLNFWYDLTVGTHLVWLFGIGFFFCESAAHFYKKNDFLNFAGFLLTLTAFFTPLFLNTLQEVFILGKEAWEVSSSIIGPLQPANKFVSHLGMVLFTVGLFSKWRSRILSTALLWGMWSLIVDVLIHIFELKNRTALSFCGAAFSFVCFFFSIFLEKKSLKKEAFWFQVFSLSALNFFFLEFTLGECLSQVEVKVSLYVYCFANLLFLILGIIWKRWLFWAFGGVGLFMFFTNFIFIRLISMFFLLWTTMEGI